MGDRIPACEQLGDLLPLAAIFAVRLEQHFIVALAPGVVVDGGVQVVVPSV